MAQAAYRQDMPPEGGYRALNFKRIPGQQYFTNRFLFAYFGALTAVNFIGFAAAKKRYKHLRLDNADREVALTPFFIAERDRAYMKWLKTIKEEEKEVMKDVSNWKTGHLWSEPVYKTLPDDYHMDPSVSEYFAHTSEHDTSYIFLFPYVKFHGFVVTY